MPQGFSRPRIERDEVALAVTREKQTGRRRRDASRKPDATGDSRRAHTGQTEDGWRKPVLPFLFAGDGIECAHRGIAGTTDAEISRHARYLTRSARIEDLAGVVHRDKEEAERRVVRRRPIVRRAVDVGKTSRAIFR